MFLRVSNWRVRGGLVHFAKCGWHFCNYLNVKDLPKFSYQIKEYRQHGEAGSVDVSVVQDERERVSKILSSYHPWDHWNLDETGLFARFVRSVCLAPWCWHCRFSAPPDHGLTTKQLSGKKREKFQITVTFACNSDGSEKMPAFFIGYSKQLRCFKSRTPK